MEKKTIWQCHNPNCNAQYGEYVNGCPKCSREPGESHKVSILNEYHPAFKGGMQQKTLTAFEESVLEKTFQRSLKDKPSSLYQPLFDHMDQEHRLILLDSEMADIIHLVEKMQVGVKLTPEQIEERKKAIDWYRNPGVQQSAVWVKAYNGMPDGIYNMKVASKIRHVVMLGVGSVVGGEIVLITFLNKTTFGKEDAQDKDVIIYFLDESATPAKESDEADLIEFAEWAAQIGWFDEEYRLWNFFEEGKMVDGRFRFTTSEFYELFKQSK